MRVEVDALKFAACLAAESETLDRARTNEKHLAKLNWTYNGLRKQSVRLGTLSGLYSGFNTVRSLTSLISPVAPPDIPNMASKP